MPTKINLLPLSKENNQSNFPSLYNNNIKLVNDTVNELVDISNTDSTFVADISSALQSNIDANKVESDSKHSTVEYQFGNLYSIYSTKSNTQSISASLQNKIDTLEIELSGFGVQVSAISGLSALQQNISDNVTAIISVSASLEEKISLLDNDYATDTMVADISGYLQTQISDIVGLGTDLPAISASLVQNTNDIQTISSALDGKLDTSVFASISGAKDITGDTIISSTIISSFDTTYAVNISASETITISGSPIQGNYLTFYDESNNINLNGISISASGLEHEFRDNKGSFTIEYRNNKWVVLSETDSKLMYDEVGDIIVEKNARLVATKLSAGKYGLVNSINVSTNNHILEQNVLSTGSYIRNANSSNTTTFNDGNYNTGEITPYEITAISHEFSSFAWKAFNGLFGTNEGWVSDLIPSGWIVIDLDTNVKQFTTMRFFNDNVNEDRPLDFSIEASNDYLVWDTLVDVDNDSTPVGAWSNMYNLSSEKTYRYYRMNIHTVNGGDQIRVMELDYREGTVSNTDNEITANFYDNANPISFLPTSFNILDEVEGTIIGTNKVSISYSVDNGPYSIYMELDDFRTEPTIECTRLDFSFILIGNIKYSGIQLSTATSYTEQTNEEIKIVGEDNKVVKVTKDGVFSFQSGKWIMISDNYSEVYGISGNGQVVDEFSEEEGTSAEWLVSASDGLNMRTSKILAIWNEDSVIQFNEVSTQSIGNTSGVDFSVESNSDMIQLLVDSPNTSLWTFKSKVVII
jgi:hypothetical protein